MEPKQRKFSIGYVIAILIEKEVVSKADLDALLASAAVSPPSAA